MKSKFVATASHEFRTPLATILSSAELLEHYADSLSAEDKLNLLHTIQSGAKRMSEMIDGVPGRVYFQVRMPSALPTTPGKPADLKGYITDGTDKIEVQHVDRAADAFGRSLMIGLTGLEIAQLKRVADTGSFVPLLADDLALILTRRVLQYQNGGTTYSVHPSIARLLAQVPTAP